MDAVHKPEYLKILIEFKADLNFENGKPLLTAAMKGNDELVKFLLENGAENVFKKYS